MKDIVLIAPADHTSLRELIGLKAPPLNLLYLASSLRENGFSVRVIDDNVEGIGPDKIARSLEQDPVMVGLTAATSTLSSAANYADAIKRRNENVTIALGGPHVSFLPGETLERYKNIDVAVLGEGEDTIVDLASMIEKGGDLGGVKGIAFHANDKVKVNDPRNMRADIDSFPLPARDLIDPNNYKDPVRKRPIGTMMTSRGCVFGCAYCASSRMMGQTFRAREPLSIVDEMEVLMGFGIDDIEFIDDIFVLNQKRAMAVASEIKKRGLDINFSASSRVDTLSKPLLQELKGAGLTSLYLGIESGSQRVLDLMGKRTTLAQVHDAVRTTKDLDVNVVGSFILGYPGETLAEMDETVHLSLKLGIDLAQYSLLTPYPGTPVFEDLRSQNLISTDDYDNFTGVDPVIDYDRLGISHKAIARKIATAYLMFYMRPSYVIKHYYMLSVIPRAILHYRGSKKSTISSKKTPSSPRP